MAHSITVPFWPTSGDCLSWSQDNQIAVVGGEHVAILSPKLTTGGQHSPQWQTTLVKINGFTATEIPRKDPLSTRHFSIGEELSRREAIGAAWSSPGLAKHKRCALAVLTANHVLSIWEADGPSESSTSWKRKLIINHAVQKYYERNERQFSGERKFDSAEQRQVQQRIRAFTWSPALRGKQLDDNVMAAAVDWGDHFLAVATEGGHMLLIHVQSPHTDYSTSFEWKAAVCSRLNIATGTIPAPSEDARARSETADYVSWGEWRPDPNNPAENYSLAPLAYVTNGQLFTTLIRGSLDVNGALVEALDQPKRHLQGRTGIIGPLQFVPGTDSCRIIAFGDDEVLSAGLDSGEVNCHGSSYHLGGRWDNVSSLAFTSDQENNIHAHFVSQLSSAQPHTSALTLSSNQSTIGAVFRPAWQDSIMHSRRIFGERNGTRDNVQERAWGIASSPAGDSIAICITLHPSNTICQTSLADQSSVLNIPREHRKEGSILPASSVSGSSSTETLLHGLQDHLERCRPPDRDSLMDQLVKLLPRRVDTPPQTGSSRADVAGFTPLLVRQVRLAMYSYPAMRTARANNLIEIAMGNTRTRDEAMRSITQQLTTVMSRLSRDKLATDDPLSAAIRKVRHLLSHSQVSQHSSASITLRCLLSSCTFARQVFLAISKQLNSTSDIENGYEAPERCQTCESDIPFESMEWAKCASGHQFQRCSLSFVALQKSGTTRSCVICGLQCLGNEVLPRHMIATSAGDVEMSELPDPEAGQSIANGDTWVEIRRTRQPEKPTLGWLLFSACDLCLYCGGKFVG
ncbi:Hypothetical predicted protein [Lecanosticta acicola]|uniref:Transcription factor IIIC 90kDa subunit N-terminal domain-containing protein n=1 Tax=Lecanosticta acicola TaxID=111012 RepID=A0AAI9E923_9PEZI|nr:Hypothetical predicted protein [Lecanosticta acicola]